MGQITIGEQAAPAAPSSGIIIYPTIATPSIARWIDDSGVDRAIAPWIPPIAWTPGISFGGGVTGITYGSQTGRYQRIGNMLFAYGFVSLTNKGSSTGSALITGLPVAAVSTASLLHAVALRPDDLTGITGMVAGYIANSGTTIVLSFLGTGTNTIMTQAHFLNTTNFVITAAYEVA